MVWNILNQIMNTNEINLNLLNKYIGPELDIFKMYSQMVEKKIYEYRCILLHMVQKNFLLKEIKVVL